MLPAKLLDHFRKQIRDGGTGPGPLPDIAGSEGEYLPDCIQVNEKGRHEMLF